MGLRTSGRLEVPHEMRPCRMQILSNPRLHLANEGLAPNATHGAARGDELGFADVVPGLFLPDYSVKKLAQIFITSSTAEPRAQVVFDDAEEAGAEISIGGQPKPVAMAAE